MNLIDYIYGNWKIYLKDEFQKEYFIKIQSFLIEQICYLPKIDCIFEFSKYIDVEDVKVVIVGQDPYQTPQYASGIAFSTPSNLKKIPSCCHTLYKAIKVDYPNFKYPNHGCLINWLKEGVLLLNDTLTVNKNKPGSHCHIGWSIFTNKIIRLISQKNNHVVFLLCGIKARVKKEYIDFTKHLIIETVHPSHYNADKFIKSHNFKKINTYLKKHNITEITWKN
ncbi:uracil-DNA glycosylase [Enterocytozoon bieneusi H348]|nr:uracil-DNA glycosylase [Enterocytozoon bieneusi H348]|eukprot:XP_002650466.1 uracil-DNA glycosylase [Enterocytozoon bieneusi H348]